MHSALCDLYDIDTPIFAFSHSPAVGAIALMTTQGSY